MSNEKVLVVDLDGTLLKVDTLIESFIWLVRYNFLCFLKIMLSTFSLTQLKSKVSASTHYLDLKCPINHELVKVITAYKKKGYWIVLATASHENMARQIMEAFPCFDEMMASTDVINLKGIHKARALNKKFGHSPFIYAGDSRADIAVWRVAKQAILINPSRKIKKKSEKCCQIINILTSPRPSRFICLIKLLRVHQWVKNSLIFIPLILSHQFLNLSLIKPSCITFLAFSFVASAMYIINDTLDLFDDRGHPKKKYRPLASGDVSVYHGLIACFMLLTMALILALSFYSGMTLVIFLCLYVIVNLSYTFYLKKIIYLDVFVLSSFYVIRVAIGAAVLGLQQSPWLLSFSFLFFLSLSFAKRFIELSLRPGDTLSSSVRSYQFSDITLVNQCGLSSAFSSVILFCIYVTSDTAILQYRYHALLLFIAPIILLWMIRIWHLCVIKALCYDPVSFAIKDKLTWLMVVFMFFIVLFAM